ncbi:hypothetical protein [Flavobacterium urocaniciphilum]|uniref:Uncharacterized protein n=1 Tax=Flavobacterium urocaniciphilum TaxID=1299341 RepID=A0A1H8YR96_9FLAO|nr:hypothetical protein [Flavobacterium urocaniciphilum]SEP54734.1 hypothetical protein SAMN05444005_10135 [Flavobacterium urocaniciphilum]
MKNEIFKKLLFVLALFTVSFSAVAQDGEEVVEEAPEVVIDMDFNKSLYANNFGNMYMSETPKAVLMAMVVPQSYESGKAELKKSMEPDLKNFKVQEFTENGVKYFACTGIMNQNNEEVYVEVMVKKVVDDSCLMVTSMYEVGVKTKYEKEAKKAILSAKVID